MNKPSQRDAEEAVRTLIAWAGDNPERAGLLETPKRVIASYNEFFSGYHEDPEAILSKTFDEAEGYNEMVVVKDIPITSHCEHHMVPIIGHVHVAYIPDRRIVGLSKLARVVRVFSKRLQTQEKMTIEIAEAIQKCLQPLGVGVLMNAQHQCMTTRGVNATSSSTLTSHLIGSFRDDSRTRQEFLSMIGYPS